MPEKPIVTSATNQHYQKRFDRLAELAAVGDWTAIAAYEVKGNNTYAKEVARYRDRLLAAHSAQEASAQLCGVLPHQSRPSAARFPARYRLGIGRLRPADLHLAPPPVDVAGSN
jgi:hypothetical protein